MFNYCLLSFFSLLLLSPVLPCPAAPDAAAARGGSRSLAFESLPSAADMRVLHLSRQPLPRLRAAQLLIADNVVAALILPNAFNGREDATAQAQVERGGRPARGRRGRR